MARKKKIESAEIEKGIEQKGLGALLGVIEWEEAEVSLHLLPETVGPRPERALVRGIKEVGVIAPVLLFDGVAALEGVQDGDSAYQVIDGNRRIAAAREAGLASVPARIAVGTSPQEVKFALSLISNEQRSPNPVAEYQGIERLLATWGMDEKRIAKVLSIPIARVRWLNRLSRLIPYWMSIFMAGGLGANLAYAISGCSADEQLTLMEEHQEGVSPTIKRIAEFRRVKREEATETISRLGEEEVQPEAKGTLGDLARRFRFELDWGSGDDLPIRIERLVAELEAMAAEENDGE